MRHAPICRVCGAQSAYRSQGPPPGWYYLTVGDQGANNGQHRALGLFCSIACLGAHLPAMAEVEQDIASRKARVTP